MSERDPIEYLLNAMERAAQQDNPASHGYGDERRAVLEAIRTLRRERDELGEALQAFIDFEIGSYNRTANAAKRYCELRRNAVRILSGMRNRDI